MTQRIPSKHVRVWNVVIAEGRNGKVWLIGGDDLPVEHAEYCGEGLEPDDAAMKEFSEWIEKFFLKNIAEATWPEDLRRQENI